MDDRQINTLLKIFYGIAALLVLTGAYFKIQHYSHAMTILAIGLIIGSIVSGFDTTRLKKRNKYLEEKIKEKE